MNVQAAKGFRLGGINDPLNIPLCSPADALIFGPLQSESYDDETLWNYEAGVKYSKGIITANAAIFHTKIKDLQVTVDAGGCSSRIVFNADKAHTTGVEGNSPCRHWKASICRWPAATSRPNLTTTVRQPGPG